MVQMSKQVISQNRTLTTQTSPRDALALHSYYYKYHYDGLLNDISLLTAPFRRYYCNND